MGKSTDRKHQALQVLSYRLQHTNKSAISIQDRTTQSQAATENKLQQQQQQHRQRQQNVAVIREARQKCARRHHRRHRHFAPQVDLGGERERMSGRMKYDGSRKVLQLLLQMIGFIIQQTVIGLGLCHIPQKIIELIADLTSLEPWILY